MPLPVHHAWAPRCRLLRRRHLPHSTPGLAPAQSPAASTAPTPRPALPPSPATQARTTTCSVAPPARRAAPGSPQTLPLRTAPLAPCRQTARTVRSGGWGWGWGWGEGLPRRERRRLRTLPAQCCRPGAGGSAAGLPPLAPPGFQPCLALNPAPPRAATLGLYYDPEQASCVQCPAGTRRDDATQQCVDWWALMQWRGTLVWTWPRSHQVPAVASLAALTLYALHTSRSPPACSLPGELSGAGAKACTPCPAGEVRAGAPQRGGNGSPPPLCLLRPVGRA